MQYLKGSVNIDFADIRELLKQLPDEFILKDIRQVQRKEWSKVADEAKRLAPMDTGGLRKMIVTKVGYDKRNKVVFANFGLRKIRTKERQRIRDQNAKRQFNPGVKGGGLEYDAYYGLYLEFGTRKMKAQPFMRPAFDNNFHQVLSDYADALKQKLEWRLEKLKNAQRKKMGK